MTYSSHFNAHDYSSNTNKKVAKLETDLGLLKKKLDNTLPIYNIKSKFDLHSYKILKLEGNYYRKDDIPELKKEIRNLIMSELIRMEIVDENELDPPLNEKVEEENEENEEENEEVEGEEVEEVEEEETENEIDS
jgi:hypothetical protein